MPGIVGFVATEDVEQSRTRLETMAQAMVHDANYRVDRHAEAGWGLGRVSIPFGPVHRQPLWNAGRTVCLVMDGELYGTEAARRELMDRGHALRDDSDAELLLCAYLERGEAFADPFNGAYNAAVYDLAERRLLLATDHLGQRPLYYAQIGPDFYFAGAVAALLSVPAFPRRLDATAVAQMLGFEHVLGDRTLFQAARLAPAGTVMTVYDGRLVCRRYWQVAFPDTFEARPDEAYLEDLAHHTRQAAARHSNNGQPATQLLSGGLDSRQLLGALAEVQPPGRPGTLHTLTLGQRGCSDQGPAAEIARKAGTSHRFYELTPAIIPAVAEAAVRRLDGLKSFVHAHAMAPWLDTPAPAHIVYKGFLGDKLWTDRPYSSQYSDEGFTDMLWRRTLVLFGPEEQADLLSPSLRREMDEPLDASFRTALATYREPLIADRFAHFIISERQRRFIQLGVEGVRSQHAVRTPFTDRYYAEFVLSLPTHLRVDRQIQLDVVVLMYPELAKVPWELTGLPMMPCLRDSTLRLSNSLRWTLRNKGLSWVPVWQRRPMTDYDGWMRNELRPWVEAILLDPQALSRGFFNPDIVRRLVAEHAAGVDHSRKLAMLMTLELWRQAFIG